MRERVSHPYEAILTAMVLCVLIAPTGNDEIVSRQTVGHSWTVGLAFQSCVTTSPTHAGWFCTNVIRFVSATAFWKRLQGLSCQGVSIVRSTVGHCGLLVCRIILFSVSRSNHCYWHSFTKQLQRLTGINRQHTWSLQLLSLRLVRVFWISHLSTNALQMGLPFLGAILNLRKTIISTCMLQYTCVSQTCLKRKSLINCLLLQRISDRPVHLCATVVLSECRRVCANCTALSSSVIVENLVVAETGKKYPFFLMEINVQLCVSV
jgi:hypothetical protein